MKKNSLIGSVVKYNSLVIAKLYNNADTQKKEILDDNRGKSGIYLWTNLISGKRYVGSSVDIRDRMYSYYNVKYLSFQKSMHICASLLKHGYSNFSLTILEYCEPEKCLEREGYYFKLLQPEYNISLDPTWSRNLLSVFMKMMHLIRMVT